MSVQRSVTAPLVPLAFGLAACGGGRERGGESAILKSLGVKAGTTVTWTSIDTVGTHGSLQAFPTS